MEIALLELSQHIKSKRNSSVYFPSSHRSSKIGPVNHLAATIGDFHRV